MFPAAIVVGRQRTRNGEAWSRAHHRRNSIITKAHAPTLSGPILGLSTLSRSPPPTLTSLWPIFVFFEATGIEPTLVVRDKRKEWPLPRRCRCVLEGPLVADFTLSRMSASVLVGHGQPMRRVNDGSIASPRLRRDHEQ